MHQDFAANLRLLCSYYRSIADVCRRLDINRPQFNRYLSGRYKPLAATMRRICDFFGVEEHEILLPHAEFKPLIRLRPQTNGEAHAGSGPRIPETLIRQGCAGMARYLGAYFEYYRSMSRPERLLRTLVCLEQRGDTVVYQRTERMKPHAGGKPCHNRYLGTAFFLTDRIFMVDHESINGHEITQTILFPSFKSRVTRLSGLKLGVADNSARMPCSVRVLYERLDERTSARQALSRCGLLEPDSPDIAPEIRAAVRNDIGPGDPHFRARY
ncbi:helix-turn-helix domain-containing protein [Arhodomonas sp. AD133]|uniref:helix-turn-helix domain-containing protein n=1 Tax=Arhodomonas sp. AD133 TaxID=3415009 RepID=UPI003EC0DCA2